MKFSKKYLLICFCLYLAFSESLTAQDLPKIISDEKVMTENYLPDFSYAGYHNGEKEIPFITEKIVLATDFGVVANDGLDDTKNLLKAVASLKEQKGNVVLQLPAGRIILSEILYLERSNFVLRGAGSGKMGTEIYFPRPLMYTKDPEDLQELREYLIAFDKRQREKENNIDLPFSQYAWSGGFIWTRVPGERVKSYLEKYQEPHNVLAKIESGKRGDFKIKIKSAPKLKAGQTVLLQLFNKEGEQGSIIKDLYQNAKIKIGSHHWNFPNIPLVYQQVTIAAVEGNTVTLKSPLTIDFRGAYQAQLVEWKHLEEVGIEHLKLTFPESPSVAHHVEPGYNGIYLTRVFNSWVKDIVIENADSGILTEEISSTTIKNITTQGTNMAHYTVAMAGVHNVLAENVKVFNKAVHPLSFNTFSTKNVYLNCEVFVDPLLDQHSGANHQNLFDQTTVHLTPAPDHSYPLFSGGGAPYWKPSHGSFSVFWNTKVRILGSVDFNNPVLLHGINDGPLVRVIGTHGNHPLEVKYGPDAYIEMTNTEINKAPSLYRYQLSRRLKK